MSPTMLAYIRVEPGRGVEVRTPSYPLNDSLRRLAREHSTRTTQPVELVGADGTLLARYQGGEEVET